VASDGDRKDRDLSMPGRIVDDEGAWDAAIDEWDKAFNLPEESAAAGQSTAVPAGVQLAEDVREMYDALGTREAEVAVEQGEALGSLLGSATQAPARDKKPAQVLAAPKPEAETLRGMFEELDLRPGPLFSDEMEIDVSPKATPAPVEEWDQLRTPPPLAPKHRDEPTPLRPPSLGEVREPAPGVLPTAPAAALAPATEPWAASSVTPRPRPSALDLLDEMLSVPKEEEPEIEMQVEAGEVLPRAEEAAQEAEPSELPVDLAESELQEPALQPPPIPEGLAVVDLSRFDVPARGAPTAYGRRYWERLAERLQFEASLTDASIRAAAMEFMVARAFEELGEEDEAIDHYREVLNHRPSHVPSMRELRRIYTRRREFDQVAELLTEMAERVGPEEKQALLTTRAELLWGLTGDDLGARTTLDQVADPGSRDLRTLLVRADFAAAAQTDELPEILFAIAEVVGDPQIESALLVEVGRLREVAGQLEEAAAAYRRSAAADRDCHGAQEGLIRVAAGRRDAATLADALGSSGVHVGLWGARRCRRRAKILARERETQAEALAELAQAETLAPQDPLVLQDLAQARNLAGDAAGAITAFTALAEVLTEPEPKAAALVAGAVVAETRLKDRGRAMSLYREAAALRPGDANIRIILDQLTLSDPDLDGRIAALRAAAETDAPSRPAHHFAAALCELELGREDEAAMELLACLEHDPLSRLALSQLEKIYRRTNLHDRLAAVLDTAAEAAEDPDEATDLRERAASLYEGKLGKPDAALRRYRQIVESGSDRPFARLGIIRCLSALGAHSELADELSLAAGAAVDPESAARLWAASGSALWAAARAGEADASYRMAAERSPGYLPAAWALVIADAGDGRWSDVVDRLSVMVEQVPKTSPERKALLMRIASLQESQLDDSAEALRTYEVAATPPLPAPGARDGARRMARRLGHTERLVEHLEQDLAASTSPADRFALLITLGDFARRLGNEWKDAEVLYHRAAEEVPGHPVVRQALEQLYAAQQAHPQLADLLLSDLKDASAPQGRVKAYGALADLDLRRGDEESARLSCESIIELDPRNLLALRFLERHALSHGRLLEQIGALRRRAESASASSDAAALWLELGRFLSHHPAEETEAMSDGTLLAAAAKDLVPRAAYLKTLEGDPACLLALRCLVDEAWTSGPKEELARLYLMLARAAGPGRDAAIYLTRSAELSTEAERPALLNEALDHLPGLLGAAYALRDAALRLGDWVSAARAAEAEGRASKVQEHVAAAWLLAGDLAQTKIGSADRAVVAFRAALDTNPSDVFAFAALRRHAEEAGRFEDLFALLEARLRVERSRGVLVDLHRDLATVAKDRLMDRTRAKQELQQLLELRPEDPEALGVLAEMCAESGEWVDAADALIRLARLEKNPIALRDLFCQLGRIYQEETPDLRRAIASFNKVITLDPGHLEALSRLGDLYWSAQDYKRALTTATHLYERETDPGHKVGHLLRISRIHEDGLKDPHQAAIAYRQALELDPSNLNAVGELCGFFARQGDQRSLMVHLDRSVASMRAKLRQDPFDLFAYHALFKIFGWRRSPDGCLCAAQVLEALGEAAPDEQEFIDTHRSAVGTAGAALGVPEYDELLFQRSVPGGFRQVFQLLGDPSGRFARLYRSDLASDGASRSDRVTVSDHPVRRIGDALARDLGVSAYDLYLVRQKPMLLQVENTDPPAILVGSALVDQPTEEEMRFLMARCLWVIRKRMTLPYRMKPEELEVIVAAIVRQYSGEFHPADVDPKRLHDETKRVDGAIARKLRNELMPFALECSGSNVDLRSLGAAVIHSANRAGLLACRSIHGALSVLRKACGRAQPARTVADRVQLLRGNEEAEELLRFAVSDTYFELRRVMDVAAR
jgi:lipopolysaccharide biosynthesis regulator YciM